jgi:PAS domain S-box-containing protein
MTNIPDSAVHNIRQRAEEKIRLGEASALSAVPLNDARQLHELQVHQIELEMQNDELRRAQRELETQNCQLLFDLAPIGYLTVNTHGLIEEANRAAATMFDVAKSVLLHNVISGFIFPEDQHIYVLYHSRLIETGELQSWELRMLRSDGTTFWAQLQAIPAYGGKYLVTIADISTLKQTEAAFQVQEQFLRSTIDGLSAHVCVIDAHGCIVITNRAWDSFGAENSPSGTACGTGFNYLSACTTFSGEEQATIEETATGIKAVIAGTLAEYVQEYPCHSQNEQRWFSCRVNPFAISGVHYAVISHENISERKRTEELLREVNDNYRIVFNNANDGILILTADARIQAANPVTVERLGYTHAELTTMVVNQVYSPEEAQLVPGRIAKLMEIGNLTFETTHQRKDGSLIATEVSSTRITWNGSPAVVSFCRDITERKMAYQSRLTAMGELISAISHQWRQPLATLGMMIQRTHAVGTMQVLTTDYLNEFKANAMRQIRYMSDTIDEFRDFYRPEKLKVPFSPLSCISDAARLFEPQFTGSDIVVAIQCDGCDDQVVDGFSNEFKQVILNLLGNARDAILRQRTSGGEPAEGRIGVNIATSGDGAIIIDISDNGCGIAADIAPRIFAPYFTTKEESGGTGIGLYISRMIVEDSLGGHIKLIQGLKGATFRITLPLEKLS